MTARSARAMLAAAPEVAVTALAMAGDAAAFDELVRRREGDVRRLLRRLSGDAALADDLAQDVFIQAWTSIVRLHSSLALGAWLRRIAVNTWLQHLRKARLPLDSLEDSAGRLDDAAIRTGTPAPGDRIDLAAALSRLSARDRVCVALSYGEGLSHGEISALTRWPLGTVKSCIARGAGQLRRSLGPRGETDD